MDTAAVLTRIQSSGLTLRASGDRLVVDSTNPLTEQQRQFIRQHKASILKALAADSAVPGPAGPTPVAASTAVTAALPTHTEASEPAPEDRFCYQCASFQRSPYGFPLGLCLEHGMPEGLFSDVRSNRIQHGTSRPAQFGCITFELRAPDINVCTVCQNYNAASTMCRVVNVGCPLPAIPPCRGTHFQPGEVRA